eukprot:518610-Rhodomonas_salina.1
MSGCQMHRTQLPRSLPRVPDVQPFELAQSSQNPQNTFVPRKTKNHVQASEETSEALRLQVAGLGLTWVPG